MNDEMVCKGVTLVYFCLFIYQCTPTPTPTNQFIYIFCLSNQGKGICITQFTSKKEQELFFVSSFIYRRHILLETMKMSRKLLTGIKKKKKKNLHSEGKKHEVTISLPIFQKGIISWCSHAFGTYLEYFIFYSNAARIAFIFFRICSYIIAYLFNFINSLIND